MIEEATTFDVSTRHSAMSYLIVYLCEMYFAFDNVMLDCIYVLRHVEINFRLIFLSTEYWQISKLSNSKLSLKRESNVDLRADIKFRLRAV